MAAIQKTFYVDYLEEIEVCGSKFFSFNGGAFQLPYDIKPADGEHNYSVCSGCTKQREYIINEIIRVYKFPNCCEWHKKLHQLREFKMSDFTGIEGSVADKIMFTHQFVINHIENDDWFEDFENYFEYVVDSLGSFPNGYGSPYAFNNFCGFLPDLVEGIKDKYQYNKLPKEEIDRRIDCILNHINNSFYPIEEEKKIASTSNVGKDMNLLLSTYNKWYKTFPFELSYFKPLQQKYSRTLPILDGSIRYNKYTGLTTAKLQKKENFTQFLVQLTKNIITNINGLRLYEKGLLTDAQNIRFELILKNRDLELSAINSVKGIDTKGYIKILKNWFKSEKKFIEEITPIIENTNTKKLTDSIRPNRTDLAYFIYYLSETKQSILKNTFPSDAAWKEFGELHNKNSKNIQQVYNEITKDRNLRLAKSKIGNINYVIDNMLSTYGKASDLAKDELKLAELNS
ncbi:hypothetical protein [Flavobacterium sp.]|uniref:hypothetical protein n=1 Tax=Flavobacterium sp. TaxID=239 RepID=UPI003B9A4F4F